MAEESMQMVNRVAVGTGSMKAHDRQRLVRAWQQAAAGGARRNVAKPTRDDLRRLGIGVVRVPKKPTPPTD